MNKFAPFEASDYLNSEEAIAEYLSVAAEDPNPDIFLAAIADVAKARGMAKLALESGLGRESLYKALRPGSKPRYETIAKDTDCAGCKDADTTDKAGASGCGRIDSENSPQSRLLARLLNPGVLVAL